MSRIKGAGVWLVKLSRCWIRRLYEGHSLQWEYEYNQLVFGSKVLHNVNYAESKTRQKRALVVYTVSPFLIDQQSNAFRAHTNRWRSVEIAKILDEFGYTVDVMDFDDHNSRVEDDYDLLLGFGRADDLAQRFPQRTVKLLLGTGSEANFQNQRERERVAEINRKRNCGLVPVRLTPYTCSQNLRYYDALVCLGSATTAATFRPFFDGRILLFNNHGYNKWMGLPEDKNFEESRYNFLYFAGSGQVLNGLDLLLELFAKTPHLNLHVCGPFETEPAFVACFRKELYETPNIYPVGWVNVGAPEYWAMVRRCGMVIVPICSGAGHGAVTVCMGNGLIPIITGEAGIDIGGLGVTLSSYGIDDIAAAIDWVSGQPAEWHAATSRQIVEMARREFSQEAFSRRFREILDEVLADK